MSCILYYTAHKTPHHGPSPAGPWCLDLFHFGNCAASHSSRCVSSCGRATRMSRWCLIFSGFKVGPFGYDANPRRWYLLECAIEVKSIIASINTWVCIPPSDNEYSLSLPLQAFLFAILARPRGTALLPRRGAHALHARRRVHPSLSCRRFVVSSHSVELRC